MKTKNSNTQEAIIERFRNKILLNSDLEDISEKDQTRIEEWLSQELQAAEERGAQEMLSLIKPIFNEWAGGSRYITGAWNTGEDVDRDKSGEYWDDQRRTAWEQFAYKLDSKLAGKEISVALKGHHE